jgi:hypothetical protein
MDKEFRVLSWTEELAIAEEQTPGHTATRGPGNTIVLTPDAEAMDKLRAGRAARSLGARTALAEFLDESVA